MYTNSADKLLYPEKAYPSFDDSNLIVLSTFS